jgi:GDPmannose 4,6-dehydratase
VLDYSSINALINKIKPNEIYNLAAQSHVAVSFQLPVYTAQVNAIGTLNILEAIRHSPLAKKIKFYQASSSEMYGLIQEKKQNEKTNFYPLSPYGTSKVFAYWITRNYREAYNLFACNGILFNHESPRRGETFVTKKITSTLCKIALGYDKCLYLGNLNSLRDWGHAKEYAEMQWKMMQKKKPSDYVIATGKQHSVKDFVNKVCKYLQIKIKWIGKNKNEKAIVIKVNKIKCPAINVGSVIVKIDKNYLRPMDVENLIGDSRKARKELKWTPKLSLDDLVKEMVDDDYKKNKKLYNI